MDLRTRVRCVDDISRQRRKQRDPAETALEVTFSRLVGQSASTDNRSRILCGLGYTPNRRGFHRRSAHSSDLSVTLVWFFSGCRVFFLSCFTGDERSILVYNDIPNQPTVADFEDPNMRKLPYLLLILAGSLPGSARAADDSNELASKAMGVLDKYCSRCHSGATLEGNFDVRVYKTLFEKYDDDGSAYILPKDPKKSYIWTRIEAKSMPPKKSGLVVSDEDKKVIKEWIEAGSPEPILKEKPRVAIPFAETITAIRDHLRATEEEDQPYQRYFVLTSAHNDPRVKDADLRMYRAALSKAINSLTWKRGIVLPEAVDKAGTIYVIDLRDLDWDARKGEKDDLWQAMMKYYPYGLNHEASKDEVVRRAARDIAKMADSKLIYMRADWFVATATLPPLYHTILRLPDNAPELEKKLGVDIAANFKRGRLWRAGFKSSGVSAQNRLIERHDSLYGAYWKSYDFKEGGEKSDLLRFPLGPDLSDKYQGKNPYKHAAFAHDGGEVIFNLPNGLQGYFLLDGKDGRIDKGPITVVHDKLSTSGSPEIVTGVSCMTCHAKGMIFRADVIRESTSLEGHLRDKVRRLYPPHSVMKKKMKEDTDMYMTALEKATGSFLLTKDNKDASFHSREGEPIGMWARKYRLEDLSLEDVAYELGKTPVELRAAIQANPSLRKLVGLLLTDKVKRADWEELRGSSLYQRVSRVLELGVPISPE